MPAALAYVLAVASVQSPSVATTFAYSETQKKDFYTTKLKLPVFKGSPLADFATVQLGKETGTGLAAWMKENFSGAAAKTKPRLPYFYDVQPFVSMATPNLISVYFTISTFEAGAHPRTVFDPHTFAMIDGKPVEVQAKNLFRPDVKFVPIVSSLVMSKLMQNDRAEWVQDGTVKALTPDQVESFVVTPSSITYLFNPYDMGPYAVGSFQVKVPFSELASDLDKAGALASVLK